MTDTVKKRKPPQGDDNGDAAKKNKKEELKFFLFYSTTEMEKQPHQPEASSLAIAKSMAHSFFRLAIVSHPNENKEFWADYTSKCMNAIGMPVQAKWLDSGEYKSMPFMDARLYFWDSKTTPAEKQEQAQTLLNTCYYINPNRWTWTWPSATNPQLIDDKVGKTAKTLIRADHDLWKYDCVAINDNNIESKPLPSASLNELGNEDNYYMWKEFMLFMPKDPPQFEAMILEKYKTRAFELAPNVWLIMLVMLILEVLGRYNLSNKVLKFEILFEYAIYRLAELAGLHDNSSDSWKVPTNSIRTIKHIDSFLDFTKTILTAMYISNPSTEYDTKNNWYEAKVQAIKKSMSSRSLTNSNDPRNFESTRIPQHDSSTFIKELPLWVIGNDQNQNFSYAKWMGLGYKFGTSTIVARVDKSTQDFQSLVASSSSVTLGIKGMTLRGLAYLFAATFGDHPNIVNLAENSKIKDLNSKLKLNNKQNWTQLNAHYHTLKSELMDHVKLCSYDSGNYNNIKEHPFPQAKLKYFRNTNKDAIEAQLKSTNDNTRKVPEIFKIMGIGIETLSTLDEQMEYLEHIFVKFLLYKRQDSSDELVKAIKLLFKDIDKKYTNSNVQQQQQQNNEPPATTTSSNQQQDDGHIVATRLINSKKELYGFTNDMSSIFDTLKKTAIEEVEKKTFNIDEILKKVGDIGNGFLDDDPAKDPDMKSFVEESLKDPEMMRVILGLWITAIEKLSKDKFESKTVDATLLTLSLPKQVNATHSIRYKNTTITLEEFYALRIGAIFIRGGLRWFPIKIEDNVIPALFLFGYFVNRPFCRDALFNAANAKFNIKYDEKKRKAIWEKYEASYNNTDYEPDYWKTVSLEIDSIQFSLYLFVFSFSSHTNRLPALDINRDLPCIRYAQFLSCCFFEQI